MPPRRRRTPTFLTALAATALALAGLSGCGSGGSSHAGGSEDGSGEAPSTGGPSASGYYGALLPANQPPREFTLTDQYGRRVSLRDLRGRVVILAFLYTASKTTAPLIAQQIRGALDELESEPHPRVPHQRVGGQPIPALAISVSPAGDTPAHVRAFLRETSLTGRLEYLTGTPAQLRAVWRAYGVVPASAGASTYESATFVLLLDRTGGRRVEFPVEQLTPEALAHDIGRLEAE
ncbi:MAG TPA: SCO family protein [Solirubrobacteraceae bacterium]|jgi:protein SCO1/2|nr:SCO family protein [Solirubrobacteraceae bacterium]